MGHKHMEAFPRHGLQAEELDVSHLLKGRAGSEGRVSGTRHWRRKDLCTDLLQLFLSAVSARSLDFQLHLYLPAVAAT